MPEPKKFLPMAVEPDFDSIPDTLKKINRWVSWQLQPKQPTQKEPKPKPAKVPMTIKNGELVNAAINKPENWLTFDVAINYYNRAECSGIGFALSSQDSICCVDIDKCYNSDGRLNDVAKDILALCDYSWAELSQSGTGIHIWFIDSDFNGGRKAGSVEVYAKDRYIAMTGKHIGDSDWGLKTLNGACKTVITKFIDKDNGELSLLESARNSDNNSDSTESTQTADKDLGLVESARNLDNKSDSKEPARLDDISLESNDANSVPDDDDLKLISYLKSDKCRERDPKIFYLFSGDKEEYFKLADKADDSDSVADCALARKLFYYVKNTGADSATSQRVKKIFLQSELAKREKITGRADYLSRTIQAAFEFWTKEGRKSYYDNKIDSRADAKKNFDKSNADRVQSVRNIHSQTDDLSIGISDSTSPKANRQERADSMTNKPPDTKFTTETPLKLPSPREYKGQRYFTTSQVAKIMGVYKSTVIDWREKRRFVEDIMDHDGTYLYAAERVYQLKEVYRRDWETAWRGDDSTSRADFIGTKKKIPSCPVDLKIPHSFIFSAQGISFVKKKGKPDKETGQQEYEYLQTTNTPIVPTKIFTESKEFGTKYEIAIFVGNQWRHLIVDGGNLLDSRKIHFLDSVGALIEEHSHLAKFMARIIAANYDTLKKVRVYTKPGWYNGKFIYPSGGDGYIVQRSGLDYQSLFSTRGDPELWKEKFVESTKSGGIITVLAVGAALSAPVLEILHEPNIQLHIYGTSNYAKSPQIKLGLSIYGNPTEGELFRTWDATSKNRIAMAAGFCDLPQGLDELGAMGRKAEESLKNDVYNFTSGIVNQANRRDGTVRPAEKFRCVRLSTGERPILKSNAERLIEIRVNKEIFDDATARDLHSFLADNHGHYGREWVDYVEKNKHSLFESYKLWENSLRDMDSDLVDNIEPANFRAIVTFAASYENFCQCLNIPCFLEHDDILDVLRTLKTRDEIDETARAIDKLRDFVAMHHKDFFRETDSEEFDNEYSQMGYTPALGKRFKNGEVAFFKTALVDVLENKLDFANGEKLIDDFYNADLLRCAHKRKTYPAHINGKYHNTICFKRGVIATAEAGNNYATYSD